MSTPPTIPVAVLVRAAAALKAAKDMPVGTSMPHATWVTVMRSSNELQILLDTLLKDQAIPVAMES